MAKHLFAGSNTADGFRGILEGLQARANRAVILKGGPGVGKNTLMQKAGEKLEAMGETVVYYHCSGDPDSLDGVWAKERRLFIADGTAPHLLEAREPGVRDRLLNLGECLNEKLIQSQGEAIRLLHQEMKEDYARAYRYLQGARALQEDGAAAVEKCMPEEARERLIDHLLALLPSGPKGEGEEAFAEAMTCKGRSMRTEDALTGHVYGLEAPWGLHGEPFLRPLWEAASRAGLSRTAYYDPLDQGKLLHIRIGDRIFTGLPTGIRLKVTVDGEKLQREKARLSFDRAGMELMQNQAFDALAAAKEKHDGLERYYMDAMDYEKLNEMQAAFLKTLGEE